MESWVKEENELIMFASKTGYYIDRTWREVYLIDGLINLSKLTALQPGQGALTKFLNIVEPNHTLCIEGITECRLQAYFAKRGYEQGMNDYTYVYLRRSEPLAKSQP